MRRVVFLFVQALVDGVVIVLLGQLLFTAASPWWESLAAAVVGLGWRVHVGAYTPLRQHARPLGALGYAMAGSTAGLVAVVVMRGVLNVVDHAAGLLGWWLAVTIAIGLAQDLWGMLFRSLLALRGMRSEIWWVGDHETGMELEEVVKMRYTGLGWRTLLPSPDIVDDLRDHRPRRVVPLLVMDHGLEPRLKESIRYAGQRWGIPVRTLPSVTRTTIVTLSELGLPLLGEALSVDTLPARILKRGFDLAFALALTLVLLPFGLVITALVLALDRQAPFFTHRRLGRSGRPFSMVKFRTMRPIPLGELLASSPDLAEEFAATQKLAADPRVTRLGRFLRQWSLDELPQVLNILVGDMSLVGPRPVVREELARYGDLQDLVLAVKPGLTGLWQVSGRNRLSYEARIRLDAWYVRNWTPWLDFRIFLLTFPAVLTRRGAF